MSPRLSRAQQAQADLALWQEMTRQEQELWARGLCHVAGLDEAGRGPLAGPVAAAAVILPRDAYLPGLNDSKKLSEKRRFAMEAEIKAAALAWKCCFVSHKVIDRINILNATMLAMGRAVAGLALPPDFLLIDGTIRLDLDVPQESLVKGDSRSVSIAAASVLAKCARDRFMLEMDRRYPEYRFAQHKGYPTALHKQLLREHGPSPIHRLTFRY